MAFKYTEHPIFRVPDKTQTLAMGKDGWLKFMKNREAAIAREKKNPLVYGWEPQIWKICDAMLGLSWVDPFLADRVHRYLLDKAEIPDAVRKHINILLIQGGNRSSKSEYAAKRVVQTLLSKPKSRVWCFHSNNQNSVEYQQPLIWKFLPPELRRKIKTEVGYISYNQKYGFSDNKLVLPNGGECIFRNYEQDPNTLEGGEVDGVWFDELVPPDWIETAKLRITTREGWIIVTFTPIRGYTPTVKMFVDGAQLLVDSTAFLLPKDGKERLEAEALVLEECMNWIAGKPAQPPVPAGRKFETAPRLLQPVDENARVIYFHSNDNPFGNPKQVIEIIRGGSAAFIRERYYGVANKTVSNQFPKFNLKVHGVKKDQIPDEGTNYLFVDPCDGRNFFMTWLRKGRDYVYVYREWPSFFDIPGVGVPGPWALPDGKKHDGKRGPAQDPFGFGLLQYKKEIARLEGWTDLKEWSCGGPDKSEIAEWSDQNGADEIIFERYIDSRFASSPKLENDRPVTLLERLEDIRLFFRPTPAKNIAEGVTLINDALDYNEEREVSDDNRPVLYVSRECRNTIYALQNWTGMDGPKGACKDPIDDLRYFFMSDCEFVEDADWKTEGGGHY